VDVRSLSSAEAFTTADGSTIRELFGLAVGVGAKQSLAEASLGPGQATQRHYHRESEEIYFVLDGSAEMELDGERRPVAVGDGVLIPPGAWHEIRAGAEGLRFLCCCAPPYRHEDTYFR
jgi:mannose-6-phosphate isomerase-like protein (cupin superfamily)